VSAPALRRWPAGYELRVAGHLDPHWQSRFSDLTLTRDDDGTTTLRGDVADQAELHGILTRIRDLGVTLISVAAIDPIDSP
jgi:hypothetical protein